MFPNKSSMKNHATMHSEPNVECPDCGTKLKSEYNLKAHRIRVLILWRIADTLILLMSEWDRHTAEDDFDDW